MSILMRFKSLTRRFAREESGTSTIEFVIVFPIFAFLMMMSYEVGHYTISGAMLDRGVDRAVRDVRIGNHTNVTLASLKKATCDYTSYVRDCERNLHLILEPVNARNFQAPQDLARCVDIATGIAPVTEFKDGGENELMLVRACLAIEPVFPTALLGPSVQNMENPNYAIVTTSAFVNEPNT